MSWLLAALCFIGLAVLYVGVGVAFLRFWNWVKRSIIDEGREFQDRGFYTFLIWAWPAMLPAMLLLVVPICWLMMALEERGNPLRGAWTWVLRLAGCDVED